MYIVCVNIYACIHIHIYIYIVKPLGLINTPYKCHRLFDTTPSAIGNLSSSSWLKK